MEIPCASGSSSTGMVRSGTCLGNTLRTRAGDHTSPKRKRGSGLTSLTLRASMRGVSPGVEPGRSTRPRLYRTSEPNSSCARANHGTNIAFEADQDLTGTAKSAKRCSRLRGKIFRFKEPLCAKQRERAAGDDQDTPRANPRAEEIRHTVAAGFGPFDPLAGHARLHGRIRRDRDR